MAGPEEQSKNSLRETLKNPIKNITIYFNQFSPMRKRITVLIAVALLIAAIGLTAFLNRKPSEYRVLYAGMTPAETSDVYFALQDMGIRSEINNKGQLLVPAGQYELLLLQLAAQGYPKSALSYDVFADHNGLTSTEWEKKQWLLFQLQDRIQETLQRLDGVDGSTVTLSLPEEKTNIWEIAEDQEVAKASVTLNLRKDTELAPVQITAVKNLIAAAVPKLMPENVSVIDAATARELYGEEDTGVSYSGSLKNVELELAAQKRIEDNIRRLLTPRYGEDGVIVVARVTLDFDAMITEELHLLERPTTEEGDESGGYPTRREVELITDGRQVVAGVPGEEDNTDIPTYLNQVGINEQSLTEYYGGVDFIYGHIKRQIEKGDAVLKRASISVMVDETNLTELRREELVDLVSKGADISPEFISLSALNPQAVGQPSDNIVLPEPEPEPEPLPPWVYIAIAVAAALILILVLVIVLLRRRAARIAKAKEEQLRQQTEDMEGEIERYKQELANAAKASINQKEDAITGEVRQFAKENPEITANLLRNWLKEGD